MQESECENLSIAAKVVKADVVEAETSSSFFSFMWTARTSSAVFWFAVRERLTKLSVTAAKAAAAAVSVTAAAVWHWQKM